MSDTPKAGHLATTLATWLYYLDQAGHRAKDDAIAAALDAISSISRLQAEMLAAAERQDYATAASIQTQIQDPSRDPDRLGQTLVDAVTASLDGLGSADIHAWAADQLGAQHIGADFGDTREERIQFVRQMAFRTGLPWLAEIIDRFPNGQVGSHWVMVERVTDHVRCMDPYPWDDLDEEVEIPLTDFMVKWDLAGNTGLHWS